ncbi:MAG: diacylglycerol/lipid kinase family protein [Chloroflexota bacterium]
MDVRLVYNPVAGQHDVEKALRQVVDFLESRGWEISISRTRGPGDATLYAREAVAEGTDVVVAVGGDGTLGEVATGLAKSNSALGVLPVGTGNVWAHMLGIPVWTPNRRSALLEAARILVEGRRVPIDLGRVADRYFVLWTGVGFDAQIAHDVEPQRELRRQLGNLAYFISALSLGLQLRGTRMTVSIDGRTVHRRAFLILVTNVQFYGGTWRVAPQAKLDDGLLEVYIARGGSAWDAVRHAVSVLQGRQLEDPEIDVYRGKQIAIHSEEILPVHVDGDPSGYTPVTISVVPKALQVIVPSQGSESLFEGFEPSNDERLSLGQRILDNLRQGGERFLAMEE